MDPSALLRETLLDKLKSGIWRAGHRIPTERALCAEYGLGRSAVRRVLDRCFRWNWQLARWARG